jgi:DNA-binding response OmpR family regulator
MRASVLIVEDQADLRRMLVRILLRNGFAVFQAATAELGLEIYNEHPGKIDVAIIDMVMPGMSGLDLAAELMRRHPGQKILYISGYGDSIAIEGLVRSSPDSVLCKPFTAPMLIGRLRELFRGHCLFEGRL